MRTLLKRILRKIPFYRAWREKNPEKATIFEWKLMGRPSPPPHCIKQKVLREIAKKYGIHILVETGTFYGDMVEAMKGDFDRIYSIELSEELYKKADERFAAQQHITIIQGDSGVELKKLVEDINAPALFWLDGHYSEGVTARGAKDTPVFEELSHILTSKERGHVIIIDDARCFGVNPGYPSIAEITSFITSKRPDLSVSIENDGVRIMPQE